MTQVLVDLFMKSMQDKSSENDVKEIFARKNNGKDITIAQKLYTYFENKTFENKENEDLVKQAKPERRAVEIKNELMNKTAEQFFKKANSGLNLNEIFKKELSRQKKEKQDQIKNQALADSLELYHFSSVSPEKMEGGVLKPRKERPDLVWEEMFTGVCAFPSKTGTYVLKDETTKGSFYKDDYVILYNKDPKEIDDKAIIGYGYKVDTNDFMPTVTNNGSYAKEWTSSKSEVDIKEVIPVNMEYLRNQGLRIFFANEKQRENISSSLVGKEVSARIQQLEQLAEKGIVTDYNKIFKNKMTTKETVQSHFSQFKNQETALQVADQKVTLGKPANIATLKALTLAGKSKN